MVIMHHNGFHRLTVSFCGCAQDEQSRVYGNQLLRHRLFPASSEQPKTAFTFQSLDLLCQLSSQAKVSAYNFYSSMRNLTDNPDLHGWPVSCLFINYSFLLITLQRKYPELTNVLRRYKHLLMLKRSGRGHDPNGVISTHPGELALDCTACPYPGINLPEDWRTLADY
jgi:hypothetical protein